MDIITEIRSRYDTLSKTHQRIANHVLDNSGTVGFLTLKELSVKLVVSESTILSFCAKLSCGNYVGLKKALLEYFRRWDISEMEPGTSLDGHGLEPGTFNMIVDIDRNNLNNTFEHLDVKSLLAFISAIKNAGLVHIISYGTANAVALYFQLRLQQIGFRGSALHSPDHRTLLYRIANSNANDIFVIIDFSGNSLLSESLSEYLHTTEFSMYCITNRPSSSVARYADAVLICTADNLDLFDSMTVPIAMVNLIFSAIIMENRETYATRMETLGRIESYMLNSCDNYHEQ